MRTVLIFLVILAPTAITACNYWSAIKCGYMGWKLDGMANDTILEKIDHRLEICNFIDDCGETNINCFYKKGSERYEMQFAYNIWKNRCVLINRMYKDDFVTCAIVMEKHYWSNVCLNRKYDTPNSTIHDDLAGCFGEYVKKECTSDQYRIFEEAHDMLMHYLLRTVPRRLTDRF